MVEEGSRSRPQAQVPIQPTMSMEFSGQIRLGEEMDRLYSEAINLFYSDLFL